MQRDVLVRQGDEAQREDREVLNRAIGHTDESTFAIPAYLTLVPSTALLWFRRDLRVADHPALTLAAREFERVIPVFVLDDALLHGRFASAPRTQFMLGCLRALDTALRDCGSGLVIRHGAPERRARRARARDRRADACSGRATSRPTPARATGA